jgi:hypothetical protein
MLAEFAARIEQVAVPGRIHWPRRRATFECGVQAATVEIATRFRPAARIAAARNPATAAPFELAMPVEPIEIATVIQT